MLFTRDQIQNILMTVDMNTKFMAAKLLGEDILTDQDKKQLKDYGFNLSEIKKDFPTFLQSYHWGRLSQLIGQYNASKITYNQFMDHLDRGQYLPLTEVEQYAYKAAQNRTYSHITGLGDGIKKDVVHQIQQTEQENRAEYEKVIKKEIEEGVYQRKSLSRIMSDLGHKTNDWDRNLGRIVASEMQDIFQEGRAQIIKRKRGENNKVYKEVFSGSCRHCIKAYLTNGISSKPKVFTVEELESNGTNIGKKVADWKPTLGIMHPWCRCELMEVLPGQQWDEESKDFTFKNVEIKDKYKDLPKIKIKIGNKEYIEA